MSISWTATGAMLSGWGSLAGAAAVAYAAHRAADTIGKWRRQKLTERKFDHAEAILAATYRAKDAMEVLRSPLVSGYELRQAEDELKSSDEWKPSNEVERQRHVHAQALLRRMRSTEDDWESLQDTLPLAKALFSVELEQAIEELHRQRWIFRTYVDARAEDQGEDKEWSKKIRANLHQSRGTLGDDEISKAIGTSIAAIEETCLPVLRD